MSDLREIVFGWYLPVFGWGLFAVLLSLAGMLICRGLSAGADAPAARRDSSWFGRGVSVAFLCIAIVCGAIKPGSVPTNAPALRSQVRMVNAVGSISPAEEAAMAEADEGMFLIGNWFRSGAHDSELAVSFDDGWVFPYGSNHLSRIQIMAYGEVYADEMDSVPVAAVSEELSCKPQTTRVYCGLTPDGTFRVEWREAYANRDPNQPMDASIDLHRDGRVTITENGVTQTIDRMLPFPHDGYGQDEDWVRANFTNAEEIISTGYANWVDAQVGVGRANGLYKFTATVTGTPPECSQLKVGDYSVAVTNAGEYVFLLGKGFRYGIDVFPRSFTNLSFTASDDLGSDARMARLVNVADNNGHWTEDHGSLTIVFPNPMVPFEPSPAYVCWSPSLTVSPWNWQPSELNEEETFAAVPRRDS